MQIEDITFPVTFRAYSENITFINRFDGFWHINRGNLPNYDDKTDLDIWMFLDHEIVPYPEQPV